MFFFEQSDAPLLERSVYEADFATQRKVSRSGKTRLICVPNDEMREVHARLITFLRKLPYAKHSFASVPGGSVFRTIEAHREKENGGFPRHWFACDIRDAFASVSLERLSSIIALKLTEHGFESSPETEILAFLKQFCSYEGKGLGFGLPASPDLFNLYACYTLDVPIARYLETVYTHQLVQWGSPIFYTRYMDDLIFSRSDRGFGRVFKSRVYQCVRDAGLTVSPEKTRTADLCVDTSFIVLGVSLDARGMCMLPAAKIGEVREALNAAIQKPSDRALVAHAYGLYRYFYKVHEILRTYGDRRRALTKSEQELVWLHTRLRVTLREQNLDTV